MAKEDYEIKLESSLLDCPLEEQQSSKAHPQSLLLEDAISILYCYQHAKEYTHYPDYFDWNALVLPNTHT